MKRAGFGWLVACCWCTLVVSAQQPASTTPLTGDPTVDQWIRSTFGQDVDPKELDALPSKADRTRFLVSLNETERMGAFLFRQRCNVCHAPTISTPDVTYAPRVTQQTVEGREPAVRKQITDGSTNMPAFKWSLAPAQVDAIIAYLRKVEPPTR